MTRIVLASSNRGKLAEFNELFADAGLEAVTQGSLGVTDADETGLTFVENALLKARNAAAATGLPSLGDDSGLCVDYLKGAPGLYSARYAGGHGDVPANNAKLQREMEGVPEAERGAFFICVQFAALRSAHVVHGAGFGGAGFFAANPRRYKTAPSTDKHPSHHF